VFKSQNPNLATSVETIEEVEDSLLQASDIKHIEEAKNHYLETG
jgi:hypothetical protein